jgi:regulator of sigma E protease
MSVLYFLIAISILHIVYTAGYLLACIFTGVHHQHYFLGFGPRLFSVRVNGIKFTIGIYIPIIFLSKIYQMEGDEKMKPWYAWQFSDQPLWKRLLVTYSGVFALMLFSLVAFMLVTYSGEEYTVTKEEVNKLGIFPSKIAWARGFRKGDKIIALNGTDYNDFYALIQPNITEDPQSYYTISRDGKRTDIRLNPSGTPLPRGEMFIELNAPFSIGDVLPGEPADQAGIQKGDKILEVNGTPVTKFREMNEIFENDEDGTVDLLIQRSASSFERRVILNENKKIGIVIHEEISYALKNHNVADAVTIGTKRWFRTGLYQVEPFISLISGKIHRSRSSTGGPVYITDILGDNPRWTKLLMFIAMYALFVILLNFLPIPASIVWEAIPLIYEMVTHKLFSFKTFKGFRKLATLFVVLMMLSIFIIDISRLLN